MDWQLVGRMLTLGIGAGVLSGLFGIGGGLVIVPVLVLLIGLDQKTATGTSLFALMWPVGLLGMLEYWRNGQVRAVPGIWIAVGLFLGAYFGAKLASQLSNAEMQRIYGIFLLLVGTYYLIKPMIMPPPKAKPAIARPDDPRSLE